MRSYFFETTRPYSLPDGDLDAFEEALATRIAKFDKWVIAQTQRLVNTSLPYKAVTIQPEQNGLRNWTMVLGVLSCRVRRQPTSNYS